MYIIKNIIYWILLNNLTKLSEQLGLKVTKNWLKTNFCKVLYEVDLTHPKKSLAHPESDHPRFQKIISSFVRTQARQQRTSAGDVPRHYSNVITAVLE